MHGRFLLYWKDEWIYYLYWTAEYSSLADWISPFILLCLMKKELCIKDFFNSFSKKYLRKICATHFFSRTILKKIVWSKILRLQFFWEQFFKKLLMKNCALEFFLRTIFKLHLVEHENNACAKQLTEIHS